MSVEILVLAALLGGVVAYLVSLLNKQLGSAIVIFVSGAVFSLLTYFGFSDNLDATVALIPNFVGFNITNLGLFFAVLVSFVFFMVSFFNPFFSDRYKNPNAFNLLYLMTLAGVLGVFFASNFITLFVFFEIVVWTSMFLIPMSKGIKPTVTYFIFSTVGSFAMLYAIIFMAVGIGTTNIDLALASLSGTAAIIVYVLFSVAAFAKLGAYPFFVWLPKVLGNAPDPVSAVFSGGIEKLGAFIAVLALLKITPASAMFNAVGLPVQDYIIGVIAAVTIIAGTMMAIRQDDAKKLLAYSSAANGGYILLAFAIGDTVSVAGGLFHVMAHAFASTAAFLAIGVVTYRTKTSKISELGGMIHRMPITYVVYLSAIISMAGIPPMGGFISKWLIFQALIQSKMVILAVAAFMGSIGSFLYVFRPLAALFLGQDLPKYKEVKEAPVLMLIPMIVLTLLSVASGVFPTLFIPMINNVMTELGFAQLITSGVQIVGYNGILDAPLIALIFGIGVVIVFGLFLIFPKSRKVGLMDTYTSGEFVYTPELLHYSADFYAPLERLYREEPFVNKIYKAIKLKVEDLGAFVRYFFFTNKPEVTVFWIVIVLLYVVWGDFLW